MTAHLPRLPTSPENLYGHLLVDTRTSNQLVWATLKKADPHSVIDGKPLLQVFCEKRQHSSSQIWAGLDVREHPLPIDGSQPWPDPTEATAGAAEKWPTPEMWVAAHLICNGPDPFLWKSDTGKNILDFAVKWQNPLLLDQLLRMPTAPNVSKLQASTNSAAWLHYFAAEGASECMRVLLDHGWPPNALDKNGSTALHYADAAADVTVLLDAGADALALGKQGLSIRQSWTKNTFSSSTPEKPWKLLPKIKCLDEFSLKLDRQQIFQQLIPSLFDITVRTKSTDIAQSTSTTFDAPIHSWVLTDGASNWSLVGHVAIASLRKAKSSLTSAALILMEKSPAQCLSHISTRRLSDLALVWLSCRRYGDSISDSNRYMDRITKHLLSEPCSTPQSVQLQIWEAALALDGKQPFAGNKINDAIGLAWGREIAAINRVIRARWRTPPSLATPHEVVMLDILMSQPGIFHRLTMAPGDQPSVLANFIAALPVLAASEPHLAQSCMVAVASATRNPCYAQISSYSSFVSATKAAFSTFVDTQTAWDSSLPGAKEAWASIQLASAADPQWHQMLSVLQSRDLNETTQPAAKARTGARL
jgi:hypothetical protein